MPPALRLPVLLALFHLRAAHSDSGDPYRWLEVVNDTRVMDWVRRQDERTLAAVGDPNSSPLLPELLQVLQSTSRIPSVGMRGPLLYNFWQDEQHVRGIWRRTTLEEFGRPSPTWETVLDLDALSEAEQESWVWRGCETPDADASGAPDSCLMKLSRGGADAEVIREFNLTEKAFMPPPWGFFVPEAKTSVAYQDRNTLFIGTDCGDGSFTTSGYPRTVRTWRRGTSLCNSTVVFQGEASDVSVSAWRARDPRGYEYEWRSRGTSFYDSEYWVRVLAGAGNTSGFHRLEVPTTSSPSVFADQLVLSLKSDFVTSSGLTLRSGTVAATPIAPFLAGDRTNWTMLFEPTANRSCDNLVATRDHLVLQVLDAVKVQLMSWKYSVGGQWQLSHVSPHLTATVSVQALDRQASDGLWVTSQSFFDPPVLGLAPSAARPEETEQLKVERPMFNSSGLQVSQHWATSLDGTRVPYFLVRRGGAPSDQPTILYGNGGFEISLLPRYSGTLGVAWLEKGGAYALANIRGGGEFGPAWHQSAMREGKHRSYEDFAAVAEDLIRTGVTSPRRLAAMGGSNGGLLVGNMLVQYPELFGAIVCSVPLLDMQRYTHLLAGASWIAEYGDPDNATDWAFLQRSSPYHNVESNATYPPVLFTTSTRDDRVHPAHARKMAAKLQAEVPRAANHTFFYESTEGGHGSSLPQQSAFSLTLQYSFLAETLGLEDAVAPGDPLPVEMALSGTRAGVPALSLALLPLALRALA